MGDVGNCKPPVATRFQPGNSGRPKGARSKLTEGFYVVLHNDFLVNGADTIRRVREEDPSTYLRVVAGLMPKEVEVKRALEDMPDEELDAAIEYVRSELAAGAAGVGEGKEAAAGRKPH